MFYIYLISDYFGTRQIIFDNNMNTIETHSKWGYHNTQKMVSYSIHVIAEYNLPGSKIICHQIYTMVFIDITFEDSWSDSCSNKMTVTFNSIWQQVQSVVHFNWIFQVVYYLFMLPITRLWSFNDHWVHGHFSNKNHGVNTDWHSEILIQHTLSSVPNEWIAICTLIKKLFNTKHNPKS